MNWDDEEKARDFSVVVNGMGGGVVTVTESTGKTSATLPVIYREGTQPSNKTPVVETPTPTPTPTPAKKVTTDDVWTGHISKKLN